MSSLTWSGISPWMRPRRRLLPPLVFAIAGDALAGGLKAAAVAYELPVAEGRIRRINTYRYQANVPVVCSQQEAGARRERAQQKLRAAMGRLAEGWTQEWLPAVKEHLAYWEGCDLGGIAL